MSDLHALLASLSLSEHEHKFEGVTLQDIVLLTEGELDEFLVELSLPSVIMRAKLRRAVLELKQGDGGGGGKAAPKPSLAPPSAQGKPLDSSAATRVAEQDHHESFGQVLALLCVVSAAVVPLLAACEDLTELCPNIMFYARQCLDFAKSIHKKKAAFLTVDEVGAVVLYTVEFEEKQDSVYHKANAALRDRDRNNLVKPFAKYLRLLDNALAKLRKHEEGQHGGPRVRTVWRGIKANLDSKFTKGETAMFWGLTSCTKSSEVLKSDAFLGKHGQRTLLSITTSKATSVSHLSFFPDEEELLLPLGTKFEVKAKVDLGSDLLLVELEEEGVVDGALPPSAALQPSPAPQLANVAPEQSSAILRGYGHFIHNQHAAALATFQGCKGNCLALGYQAIILWYGEGGVKRDVQAATQAATEALGGGLRDEVTKGNRHAQYVLGELHDSGLVVSEDLNKAAALFTKAANQGHAAAQFNLGYCYESGRGVYQDEKKAAEMYAKATAEAHAAAQCNLGNCFKNGLGVKKNPEKAAEQFALAAAQGHVVAQYNLGYCYFNGEGVGEDNKKAFELFSKAAIQGHTKAQRSLGICYQYGHGVRPDMEQAKRHYRLAAAQGSEEAKKDLEGLQ